MYNLLLSVAISLVWFLIVPVLGFPWISAFLPAMLTFPAAAFLLMRRTQAQVEAALLPLPALAARAQAAKRAEERDAAMAEVRKVLVDVRERYGKWQYLLEDTVDGQLGMLAYAEQKFDEAIPLLQKGTRDFNAQIALGCIMFRRDDLAGLKAAFEAAAAAAEKEPNVYLLWGTLLAKKDAREDALVAVSKGLEKLPDHTQLKHLRHQLANKQPVNTDTLQELWYQHFPEELMKELAMRGRRPGGLDHLPESIRAQLPKSDPRAGRMRTR